MKVYSMTSKTGTDFEVYTLKGGGGKNFEFIIDQDPQDGVAIVTLNAFQISDLIISLGKAIPEFSRCGCTEDDACGEWNDVAALKAYQGETNERG